MNNEVEAYVGELRELREENDTLKERIKFYETELAWQERAKVDWDIHSMILRYPDGTEKYT